MEYGIAAFVLFVIVFGVSRLIASGMGRGGVTVVIDGITIYFSRGEVGAIFGAFTDDERKASRSAAYYTDRNEAVPDDIRDAADVAFISAARRWLLAHPNIAARKGYSLP